MKRTFILLTALCATLVIISYLNSSSRMQVVVTPDGKPLSAPLSVPSITLSPVATIPGSVGFGPVSQLTAIDYQELDDTVIVSLNAPSGFPHNFEKVTRAGVHTQFSPNAGFIEEVHIAIAPSPDCSRTGNSIGGFKVGDVFVGSGFGQISKITPNGSTTTLFSTFPGETGLLWGGLAFDRTGLFNGDLIACTTSGGLWRVNAAGVPSLIAHLPMAGVKSVVVIPNDSRFGPIAGKILVGGTPTIESSGPPDNGFVVDAGGSFSSIDFGIREPEGLRIVPQGGDFFATDVPTHTVFMAPALQFSSIVGDLVIAAEIDFDTGTGRLFDITFNPGDPSARANGFLVREIPGGRLGQYEGITFACSTAPTPPCTLTCPPDICTTGSVPTTVNFVAPSTVGSSSPVIATCVPPSGSLFPPGTTVVTCTAVDPGCTNSPVSCTFNVTVAGPGITLVDIGGSGSTLTFDQGTGAYTFTCGSGLTLSGTAIITARGGMMTLQDDMGGRCVNARLDLTSCRGSATLEAPMGLVQCQITGRVFAGCSACAAPITPPPQ